MWPQASRERERERERAPHVLLRSDVGGYTRSVSRTTASRYGRDIKMSYGSSMSFQLLLLPSDEMACEAAYSNLACRNSLRSRICAAGLRARAWRRREMAMVDVSNPAKMTVLC